MRGANENIRAEKIGDEMFWLFGQELYNYGSPPPKKKIFYENLCQVSLENTSARSPFLCHVTDLVSEQYFTFSLQLFILL